MWECPNCGGRLARKDQRHFCGAATFFQDRLSGCETSKGVVRFPTGQLIPYELIAEIAAWCYRNTVG